MLIIIGLLFISSTGNTGSNRKPNLNHDVIRDETELGHLRLRRNRDKVDYKGAEVKAIEAYHNLDQALKNK